MGLSTEGLGAPAAPYERRTTGMKCDVAGIAGLTGEQPTSGWMGVSPRGTPLTESPPGESHCEVTKVTVVPPTLWKEKEGVLGSSHGATSAARHAGLNSVHRVGQSLTGSAP